MSRFDTIRQDMERVDGAETVTLRVRTSEAGDFDDYTVSYAVRVDQKRAVDGGDAMLRQTTTSWLLSEHKLRAAGVPTPSPKRGDVVRQHTSAATEWALEDVATDPLSAVHDCAARRLLTTTG